MSWVSGSIFERNMTKPPQGVLANAVGSQIAVSWESIQAAKEYEVYERQEGSGSSFQHIVTTKEAMIVRSQRDKGCVYYYRIRAIYFYIGKKIFGPMSQIVSTRVPVQGVSTLRNLLCTALAPVGSAMYIWGGGWNEEDTGAGDEAVHIGLSPRWRKFADCQHEDYDIRNYRFRRHDGLDCTGYLGWVIYNITHTQNEGKGFVVKSGKMAKTFAEYGWGQYRRAKNIIDYSPGDIMSTEGHVYMVIGSCSDGSIVLVHSSPNGVQVSGTVTAEECWESEAIGIAKEYMARHHPNWRRRFPDCERGIEYLNKYDQMRFDLTGSCLLSDPEGYAKRPPGEILWDLAWEEWSGESNR